MSAYASIIDALESDWASIARPEQIPPPGDDWLIWLILAGRGWGKTRTGAEWVRDQIKAEVSHIALVGPTAADVRDTMVENGILRTCSNSDRPLYEPSKRRLVWESGQIATLYSSEEPERLRGPAHGAAWCDELCAWSNLNEVWDQLQFTMRVGARPRQVITTTPKPSKLLRELVRRAAEDGDVKITRGKTSDSEKNLAASFLRDIHRRFDGTRLGRQELSAEVLDDVPGALWSRDLIERTRCGPIAPLLFKRVVVAIDPAVSIGEDSNLTGIVVAGLGENDHYYVLADLSGKLQPHEWGRRAIDATRTWFADRIIAEANQGGQMVEHVIRAIDKNASFKAVHASRGKITRAEPIAALFEQGRAHLAGVFPELEDELCTFEPGSPGSPDRLDACVWALSELMTGGRRAVLHFA